LKFYGQSISREKSGVKYVKKKKKKIGFLFLISLKNATNNNYGQLKPNKKTARLNNK
jgi:hypothetical protein